MTIRSFLQTFILVVLSMAIGRFVRENPLLFGFKADSIPFTTTTSSLTSTEQQAFPDIITSHPVLDAVLKHHEADIVGNGDYEKYRNHCLRVMNFAVYYHGIEQQNCQSPPPSNPEKETVTTTTSSMTEQELNIVALGLAYHDIGLWTNGGALSYLEPSVAVLEREIPIVGQKKNKNKKQTTAWTAAASLPPFTESDLTTAREIILQHHKFTSWQPKPTPITEALTAEKGVPIVVADATLVNAVRRGDWTDATMGIVKSGMSPIYLETIYNAIPTLGFHSMLMGMGPRLSPNSLLGQLDVLKILKW